MLARRTQSELAQARAKIPANSQHPRVAFLYIRGSAGVSLLGGRGSGADSMIEAAGAIDAGTAAGLGSFTPITSEALVKAAPDVILMLTSSLQSLGGVDALLQVPGIRETPAGRDRRILTVEDGLLYSFGPRSADALSDLIDGIHRTPQRSQ
jgi:iron complex transport system substrate-binding protein